ncbi:hypothetical protein AB1Y20_021060 [Prymnesium parvum]
MGDGIDEHESDDDDAAPEGSVLHSFIFQDTLTTTVVTPIGETAEPPLKPATEAPARESGSRAAPVVKVVKKKFDLNLPLQNAIPGYKPPVNKALRKKRKTGGKKKLQSKKEKAKTRGEARRRDR